MTTNNQNGSRRDVLVLLDSPGYIGALNSVLTGTGTVVSGGDIHRPIDSSNDKEYELPEYCWEHMAGRFDIRKIKEPVWWIVKRTQFVRTPNFDLISTATQRSAANRASSSSKQRPTEANSKPAGNLLTAVRTPRITRRSPNP